MMHSDFASTTPYLHPLLNLGEQHHSIYCGLSQPSFYLRMATSRIPECVFVHKPVFCSLEPAYLKHAARDHTERVSTKQKNATCNRFRWLKEKFTTDSGQPVPAA